MGWREGDRRQTQGKWAQALETRVWVSELPRSHLEGVGSGTSNSRWKVGSRSELGLALVGAEHYLGTRPNLPLKNLPTVVEKKHGWEKWKGKRGSTGSQGPDWVHHFPSHQTLLHTSAPAPLAVGEDMLALQV